ncbi:uncharacterized protein LOC125226655 [Leguminivora glycinivorella]|uniref:uncharacterized protein LOC125226655 n=1 Tax=Leguminivora glycinivorella TaxID=1035111 RepID=UPI00200BA15E|nr:uncharacterized protein LOC125226655 [Leguminivora glycinivorella]
MRPLSHLSATTLRRLWRLSRTLRSVAAQRLRSVAWNPSTCASANMPDALQCRGSRNNTLNASLYCTRMALNVLCVYRVHRLQVYSDVQKARNNVIFTCAVHLLNLRAIMLALTANALLSLSMSASSRKSSVTKCPRYLNDETLFSCMPFKRMGGMCDGHLLPALNTINSLLVTLYLRLCARAYTSHLSISNLRPPIDGLNSTMSSA